MIIGIPPFYDKSRNKMFLNIEQGPIRWPDQGKHGISVSQEAQDLILQVRSISWPDGVTLWYIATRQEQDDAIGGYP
jgi:hypothetical protein